MASQDTLTPAQDATKTNGKLTTTDTEAKSADSSATPATGAKPELSNKELKMIRQAEKQARRAKVKDTATGSSGSGQADATNNRHGEKADAVKPKVGEPTRSSAPSGGARQAVLPSRRRPSQSISKDQTQTMSQVKAKPQKQVSFLSHLYGQPRRHTISDASKDVHPIILTVAQQIAHYRICGSQARTVAMLVALKSVIATYSTPMGTSLPRHLSQYFLSPQLTHLKAQGRPFCTAQSAAIRWLKNVIATLDPSLPEHEAKNRVLDEIDTFIHERFVIADQVIADEIAGQRIHDGDVVLCYGKSAVVTQCIREAVRRGKRFRVVIADSKPLHEGRALARSLQSLKKSAAAHSLGQVDIIYVPLTALPSALASHRPTITLLGAHTVMSNGAIQARAGTALTALLAREAGSTVLVLSEGVKFAERVSADSIGGNELAPEDDIVGESIMGWRDMDNLQVANLAYDVTPPELVDAVVSELGTLPPGASLSIVRLVGSVGEPVI